MNSTPKRKLSLWRLLLAIVLLAGISFGGLRSMGRWMESNATAEYKSWFAPYIDVTATPRYAFEQIEDDNKTNNAVLSFVVSSKTDLCEPSWGGVYSLDDAGVDLDLDRRLALFRNRGGTVAVSFGGLLNDELAVNCKEEEKLLDAYKKVIDRYDIDTIDMDIEGESLNDTESLKRRAKVIAELQKTYISDGKNLAVWLTLPVSPYGLTETGTDAVAKMLSADVNLAGVNVMTMDYGESRDKAESMQKASERALIETHRQLGVLFGQAGINLSNASLWKRIGATPMIGQNDIVGEIFTIDDAKGFNEFVISKGVGRISMWSANRDIECGENYVNLTVVSDSCSGIKQDRYSFANNLGNGLEGNIRNNAYLATFDEPKTTEQIPDNPEDSPYQIWSGTGNYLEGTKVVWHHNVYQAKWWTKGDIPDNPVLQAWETPWQLIGPVLPGEKPIPQPTLPAGTYPVWSGSEIYDVGQRVLFDGVPYQTKWWTQGDSPAASTSNPDSSPWVVLTREQIEEVVEKI